MVLRWGERRHVFALMATLSVVRFDFAGGFFVFLLPNDVLSVFEVWEVAVFTSEDWCHRSFCSSVINRAAILRSDPDIVQSLRIALFTNFFWWCLTLWIPREAQSQGLNTSKKSIVLMFFVKHSVHKRTSLRHEVQPNGLSYLTLDCLSVDLVEKGLRRMMMKFWARCWVLTNMTLSCVSSMHFMENPPTAANILAHMKPRWWLEVNHRIDNKEHDRQSHCLVYI